MKPKASNAKTRRKIQVFGLTGGIASGKSSVARIFEEMGIPIVDADAIAHQLVAPGGQALDAVRAVFGTTDRNELRKLIFSKPEARLKLEALLHPLIQAESEREFEKWQQSGSAPWVLYEAALLIEKNRFSDFDGVILVTAPDEIRIQRILKRDHTTEPLARSMIAAQWTDAQKRTEVKKTQVPLFEIHNAGTLDDLKKQVQYLIPKLKTD